MILPFEAAAENALYERSGEVTSTDPLVPLLYEIVRDHLPIGVIEEIVQGIEIGTTYVFSNGWLAEYAKDAASRLRSTTK